MNEELPLRILIVDDEIEKARSLVNAILEIDSLATVDHVTTSVQARRDLREREYSLLIVDLNLPSVLSEKPMPNGGFDLFDLLMRDSASNMPSQVVFVTGRTENFESALIDAEARGLTLVRYQNDENWKKFISGRYNFIKSRLVKSVLPRPDILVVTALSNPELKAVLNLPYNWAQRRIDGDPLTYFCGYLRNDNETIFITAVSVDHKGMSHTAAISARLIAQLRPVYVFMLGICAGVKGKVGLGDVVVASLGWDYGSGKKVKDSAGNPTFLPAPDQLTLDPMIANIAREIASDEGKISSISEAWRAELPDARLTVHIGPMASGSAVVADASQLDMVLAQHRETLAVEMEAFGLMVSAVNALEPRPNAIVIKSVCDFANAEKSDKWHTYSAYTSASFADLLFRHSSFLKKNGIQK